MGRLGVPPPKSWRRPCIPLEGGIVGPLLELLQLVQVDGPLVSNLLTEHSKWSDKPSPSLDTCS